MKSKKAADIMSTRLITATTGLRVTDVIELMLHYNVSCLPVVDTEENLLGLVTEYDILNFTLSGEAENTLVGSAMSRNVRTLPPDTNFEAIVNFCVANRLHRVPIVKEGKLMGIISRRDILRELLDLYK